MDQLTLLHRARRKLPHTHTLIADGSCAICGASAELIAERRRRGRLNRARGNRIQRQRNQGLGIRNLAGNNPSLDGVSAMFATESKSLKRFPEVLWRWLKGVKLITADQTPILIITEAPGPGRKARSIVVVDYEDWKALHGVDE